MYKLYDKDSFDLKISNKLDIGAKLSIAVRNNELHLYNILNRAANDTDENRVDKLIKS